MLKHATISRTNRAQQALQLKKQQCNQQHLIQPSDELLSSLDSCQSFANNDDLKDSSSNPDSIASPIWLTSSLQKAVSCTSSPTPSLQSTPTTKLSLSSAPSSVFNSPNKSNPNGLLRTLSSKSTLTNRCGSDSIIKVFAQTLSQDVEYVTLHVNAQTKSQQIVRSLLRKFRLKHRDPNLFYLTLERWIRKDGLKSKSVMLLGDDSCPLQLQQCCSNPPHNDIKFTLQMRAGALVKIFCSDVCPNTKYKCLSLSTRTTVEETIELMLHCLNLINTPCNTSSSNNPQNSSSISQTSAHLRMSNSPNSTDSASTTSSASSSSGIESEPTNGHAAMVTNVHNSHQLDSYSRASSVTSISSFSNLSNDYTSLLLEQFCLVIECKGTNYKRILQSDEYLIDVYQNLLEEAREGSLDDMSSALSQITHLNFTTEDVSKQQPDQWFVIKLKKRDDISNHSIKFTNPRKNMPLPPLPLSLAQFNNANNLQHIVSTAQIEVNHHNRSYQQNRPNSSLATVRADFGTNTTSSFDSVDGPTAARRQIHHRQLSEVTVGSMQLPPASLIWLPPIKPRQRNLSNASSTFGRPHNGSMGSSCNRRRYDPAQLAEDLNQLNMGEETAMKQTVNSAPFSEEAEQETSNSPVDDTTYESSPMYSLPARHRTQPS